MAHPFQYAFNVSASSCGVSYHERTDAIGVTRELPSHGSGADLYFVTAIGHRARRGTLSVIVIALRT